MTVRRRDQSSAPDTLPRYAELAVIEKTGARHAWSVFGPDDEMGTLNFITPAIVAAATRQVIAGEVVNLSLPLDQPDPPLVLGRKQLEHRMRIERWGRDDWLESFYLQASSQWDGLRHIRYREFGYYGGRDDAAVDAGVDPVKIPAPVGVGPAHPVVGREEKIFVDHAAAKGAARPGERGGGRGHGFAGGRAWEGAMSIALVLGATISHHRGVGQVRARLESARELQPEMEKLFVHTLGSVPPFALAQRPVATFFFGNFLEAREQAEAILSLRVDQHLHDLRISHSTNYLVLGYAYASHAAWFLGYPQMALERGASAVHIAREFAQPFNQALAISYFAMLQEWRADIDPFRGYAQEAYTFTREYQVTYYQAWARILLQFAEASQKPNAENLARLRDAIRALTDTGARLRLPYYFSLVARVCVQLGRLDEGLDALAQGLGESQQNKEQWWDVELYRLRGELMLAQGKDTREVETEFRHAISIAQAQHAKSLELRAVTGLARLWHALSRSAEAKQLLAPVYEWFTEGFDTPDLKTAHALLQQL